jgi:hypothetical protein
MATADCDTAMAQQYTKRLSDKVLIALHQACDERDIEVARAVLDLLEVMARRSPSLPDCRETRHVKECLVAAHERLWHIQHPDDPEFR